MSCEDWSEVVPMLLGTALRFRTGLVYDEGATASSSPSSDSCGSSLEDGGCAFELEVDDARVD